RGAVERLAFLELFLGELMDRQGKVLHLARQVGEAQIDDLCPGFVGHGDDVLGRLRVRHHDSLLGAGPSTDGDAPRVGRWRDGSVTRALTLRYESPRKGAGPALSRRPLCAGGMGGTWC